MLQSIFKEDYKLVFILYNSLSLNTSADIDELIRSAKRIIEQFFESDIEDEKLNSCHYYLLYIIINLIILEKRGIPIYKHFKIEDPLPIIDESNINIIKYRIYMSLLENKDDFSLKNPHNKFSFIKAKLVKDNTNFLDFFKSFIYFDFALSTSESTLKNNFKKAIIVDTQKTVENTYKQLNPFNCGVPIYNSISKVKFLGKILNENDDNGYKFFELGQIRDLLLKIDMFYDIKILNDLVLTNKEVINPRTGKKEFIGLKKEKGFVYNYITNKFDRELDYNWNLWDSFDIPKNNFYNKYKELNNQDEGIHLDDKISIIVGDGENFIELLLYEFIPLKSGKLETTENEKEIVAIEGL